MPPYQVNSDLSQEIVLLRPFANVRRLFHGLGHALRQPEVQGVAQLALSLILIATIFYWLVEGWSLLDAAYFAVVTIATVGYGDLAPAYHARQDLHDRVHRFWDRDIRRGRHSPGTGHVARRPASAGVIRARQCRAVETD